MAVYYTGVTNLYKLNTRDLGDSNLQLLPMSREGLVEHVKRASFHGSGVKL